MLFNSLGFIMFFLPIVFIGYFLINKTGKYNIAIIWLVIASLFFYSYWNPKYFLLIFLSMVFNYVSGRLINNATKQGTKKILLFGGITGNVLLLGYFKYADFFISNINVIFSTDISLLHLVLPLAISFFTFQQIAYLVDTYRGETKQYNIFTYSLFVTFFPQLIAGPIVHHKEMMPQFATDDNKKIRLDNVSKGVFIFFIGLAKKVAIADTFALWVNDGYANYMNLTSAEAWITSLSYTMQLYFDFSGYVDMAIGIALLFNIKLPINFFSPYKSRNIQDFWRTWHMTLNRFLTQYIYIPLGGSRKGVFRNYLNIFIIFFISGFWHGAGWTFVIWGVLHGVASMISKAWGKVNFKLPFVVSWFITFMFVNAAWVYFRSETVGQAHVILNKMLHLNINNVLNILSAPLQFEIANSYSFVWFTLASPKFVLLFLAIFLAVAFFAKNSIQLLENFKPNLRNIALIQVSLLFVLSVIFFLHKNSEFLYFNF